MYGNPTYTQDVTDEVNLQPGEFTSSFSTVGMYGYPDDFARMMPGYTGCGANISGVTTDVPQAQFGMGSGLWSTSEAYPWGKSEDLVTDPQIGGYAGDDFAVPFAFGPVESNSVENFELLGAQAVFQSPDVQSYGDVGYSDLAGRLAASVSSYAYDQATYEQMATSVVNGM